MSEPLTLTCRCGWKNDFDRAQMGLELECPDCGRPVPVTDDPVAFKNRNVGDADFQFDSEEGDFSVDSSIPAAPPGGAAPPPARKKTPRRAGAAPARAPSSARRGGKSRVERSGRGAPATQSPVWANPAARAGVTRSKLRKRQALRGDRSKTPMIAGFVIAAVLGVGGFIAYRSMDTSDQQARAADLAAQIMDNLMSGANLANRSHFEDEAVLLATQAEIEGLQRLSADVTHSHHGVIIAERRRHRTEYRIEVGRDGLYYCRLDLVRQADGNWQVASAKVGEVPRALRQK